MADFFQRLRAALAGRYTIERPLGQGGMALVFLAHDLRHRRQVAIKVLRPELAEALGADRFLREIEIAAGLTHPHILPLYDSGQAQDLLYYVMPYVEGESLRTRLDREKQLPVKDAVQIAREVADALAHAHCHNVLHRDVKPENILLESGHAVVSDFGIARAISAAAGTQLTQTGIAVGTPAYMSPEQATGETHLDGRSDIYSLGCVVYEMLAGAPPFTGPTVQAILSRRLTEAPPPLRNVRPSVPEPVEHAVARALAPVPADRFAAAAEFAAALGEAPPRPLRLVARAVRPRAALGVATGLIVALGAAWLIGKQLAQPAISISPTRLAVLPFSVSGTPSLAYLGEGMADLLSRNLDGAEDLRTIDPATVLAAARAGGESRALARRVGAGLYALGSVHEVGGRVRLQAGLYAAGDTTSDALVQAAVEGDTSALFELVDRLAAELLVRRGGSPVFGRTRTAARTTHSLPALKAYLGAERDLRTGNRDSAIVRFQRAIVEDSTFALAHYRLAITVGWAIAEGRGDLAPLSRRASIRALGMSARLSDRERRLLRAYAAFLRGAATDAEREYRSILRDYPDDLEAEFLLADLVYHYNPLRGRPRSEGREAFDRVLALDPGFG